MQAILNYNISPLHFKLIKSLWKWTKTPDIYLFVIVFAFPWMCVWLYVMQINIKLVANLNSRMFLMWRTSMAECDNSFGVTAYNSSLKSYNLP